MTNTATLHRVLTEFPSEIQTPMWHFAEWLEEKLIIPHHDFEELKGTVSRLAVAQERTEHRIDKLENTVERLAVAQEKSEQRMDKVECALERLAAAQDRTEQKMQELAEAQARTNQRMDKVEHALERLAAAQDRTEQKMQELAQAQAKTEAALHSMSNRFAELGSRWGIYTEGTFRATIRGIIEQTEGMTVTQGYYGDRQVDVIIRNGEHILLEITSRVHARDLDKLYKSAEDYRNKEGVEPKLMLATSSVSPKIMQKIMESTPKIEIFTYEEE